MAPGSFSRVVVTSDLLRPFTVAGLLESATWKNSRWLQQMLAVPLRRLGHAPHVLAWDDRAAPGTCDWFDTPGLYDALGVDLSLDGWARLVNLHDAPAALVAALEPHVHDALVVGYELPPPIIDALQRLGRPYVDVVLHPVRFLSDLVFALRTNVAAWQGHLRAHRLDDMEIEAQAAHLQAKAAWMQRPMEMPPGTALLLGQVASDRAAITPDGSFATLEQHLATLHALCCEHPLVLFRPHPYAANEDPSVRAVSRLPAIRSTSHNFYHLLAQPEVGTVVALNSSGLVEARHFGRNAVNLRPFLYDFDTMDGADAPVAMTSAWATPAFWRGLLDADGAASAATPLPSLPAGTLRRAMNADWGYGFIERMCA